MPRPRRPREHAQVFIFGIWTFDITAATRLIAAAPRDPAALPVAAWARAYGLPQPAEPGGAAALIRPGPGFDPAYAMTTDLTAPVIVATMPAAAGKPMPLLIDGTHRLFKGLVTGTPELPAWILTEAETATIRTP